MSTLYRPRAILTATLILLAAQMTPAQDSFLLLDSRIIEATENARLSVGVVEKHSRNPLFAEDKPWEPRFDNLYANVLYDEQDKLYKCWYSPFIIDESTTNTPKADRVNGGKYRYQGPHTGRKREMGICYATSIDGLDWTKPDLGLVEFNDKKSNNLIWRGPHGSGIFKDLGDNDPGRRYKIFFKGRIISVAFSADGLRWSDPVECPEADVRGDTHNNAFWAPTLNQYVGITRTWATPRGRQVARTESDDFLKWTQAKVVLEGLEDHLQTYAMPVFYYKGLYLGLLALYNSKTDRTHTELTWSPNTIDWHRIDPGTPLIPNGPKGSCDWGTVYPAAYPVFTENEIRLYYGACDDKHFGFRNGFFCLATLRPDGFAGYEQSSPDKPAIVITRPVAWTGDTLYITADVGKGGSIETTILDSAGRELAKTDPLKQTATNKALKPETPIKSKAIRLKFKLKKAKLYAFALAV